MELQTITKTDFIKQIRKDNKNKYDRLAFIQTIKKVKAYERFSADSYTATEIKQQFEDVIENDTEEVIEQALTFNMYQNIRINEEKTPTNINQETGLIYTIEKRPKQGRQKKNKIDQITEQLVKENTSKELIDKIIEYIKELETK